MSRGNYQIPFNKDGDQLHYADPRARGAQPYTATWTDNHEFDATLKCEDYGRGRSAAYFELERVGEGKTVTMFLKDFMEALPHMHGGVVKGTFTFCKRGQNYGCRLVKSSGVVCSINED